MVGPRDAPVTILLSVYDGVAWLPELIESIRAQTHEHWQVLIRDDGSGDGSGDLIRQWVEDDDRISVLADDLGNLGPAASFMRLLAHVETDLFAFCDQDDVWLPEKLRTSIAALGDAPIAGVYTDAEVTDARGNTTSPSALTDRGVTGDLPFGHLLINNAAIGATLLGTAELADAAVALADDRPVLMHDWWVALVASHQGSLRCLRQTTVRWRRHDATVTGERPAGARARAARRLDYLRWSIDAAQRLQQAESAPSADARRAVDALASLDPEHPTVIGLLTAWKRGEVRAWPLRGQLALLVSAAWGDRFTPMGRTNH